MKYHNRNGTSLVMPLALRCHTPLEWCKRELALCFVIAATIMASVILSACQAPPAEVPPSEGEKLVAAGKDVFASSCAKCHGARGEGSFAPRLIGDGVLDKYKNAQALVDTVSQIMPFDAPGSLTREQYLQVVGFLVAENSYAAPKEIEPGKLTDISLTR